jgi:Asp-tRNA(Asn)/Glu-tRNA(Gln) amidotransferase B subunit
MSTLTILKDDCLSARKAGEKIKSNLLVTLISEIEMRAKNDGNREVTEDDVEFFVKKFKKNIKASLDARPDDKLKVELTILENIPLKATEQVDIKSVVDKLIEDNPAVWQSIMEKPQNTGWMVGQVMKATGGKANPVSVKEYVASRL